MERHKKYSEQTKQTIRILLAYVTPFLSEDAYQNLDGSLKEFESVFYL